MPRLVLRERAAGVPRLENNQRLAGEYHGIDGALTVSDRVIRPSAVRAFVKAARGRPPLNEDFNGAQQEGVGFYQTTTSEGRRWSSAEAFLREAESGPT